MIDRATTVVAVHPEAAMEDLSQLLAALTRALPIRFAALDRQTLATSGGVLLLEADDAVLAQAAAADRPAFVIDPDPARPIPAAGPGAEPTVVFSRAGNGLDSPPHLGGRALDDGEVRVGVALLPGDRALATVGGIPVWVVSDSGRTHRVSVALPSLAERGSALGHHLRPGRFMGLVPLVHFLRSITAATGWQPPELRASIIIDDPSFTSMSYGWLRLGDLVAEGRRNRFHVSIATVPLDARLTRRGPASLARANQDVLSVSVHGNDHLRLELGRPLTADRYQALLDQALRRMDRAAARSGLPYDRVQVPPHNLCSAEAVGAMARLDYEAVAVTARFWDRVEHGDPVLTGGWGPADITPDGLPVLLRTHLRDTRDALWLRAFLGAPLILYGHHDDTVDRCAALSRAADDVNSLGPVAWLSLAEIARTNVETRRFGDVMQVRPWSRRVRMDVPPDTPWLQVSLPRGHPAAGPGWMMVDGQPVEVEGGALNPATAPRPAHPGPVEILVRDPRHRGNGEPAGPRTPPWSVARRVLVQARDRSRPLAHRLGAGR